MWSLEEKLAKVKAEAEKAAAKADDERIKAENLNIELMKLKS